MPSLQRGFGQELTTTVREVRSTPHHPSRRRGSRSLVRIIAPMRPDRAVDSRLIGVDGRRESWYNGSAAESVPASGGTLNDMRSRRGLILCVPQPADVSAQGACESALVPGGSFPPCAVSMASGTLSPFPAPRRRHGTQDPAKEQQRLINRSAVCRRVD